MPFDQALEIDSAPADGKRLRSSSYYYQLNGRSSSLCRCVIVSWHSFHRIILSNVAVFILLFSVKEPTPAGERDSERVMKWKRESPMSNPDLFHCPLSKYTMKTFKLNPLEKFCHHLVFVRVCAVRSSQTATMTVTNRIVQFFPCYCVFVRFPRSHQFLRFLGISLSRFSPFDCSFWVFFDCSVYLLTVAEWPSIVIAACSECIMQVLSVRFPVSIDRISFLLTAKQYNGTRPTSKIFIDSFNIYSIRSHFQFDQWAVDSRHSFVIVLAHELSLQFFVYFVDCL